MMHAGQLVTFGPYLYDLELGRLSRDSQVIRVPEQNARLLTYLIQKAGRLASRDELRSALWPEGTPSDSEQAINKNISQLRYLLRDNPGKPLYIETIPQRGYRFCAEISSLPDSSATLPPEPVITAPPPPANPAESVVTPVGSTAPPGSTSSAWPIWAASALVVAAIAALALFLLLRHRSLQSAAPQLVTVAFAPIEAASPQVTEAALNLRSDLIDRLVASPSTRVIAANSSKGLRADSTLAAQAAKLGLDLVIFGYLSAEGDNFHLRIELVRPSDSSHIATYRYTANTSQWDKLCNEATNDILTRMKLHTTDGADIGGTKNPRAFEVYMHGRDEASKLVDEGKNYNAALADYREAVRLDPNLGNAYTAIARTALLLCARGLIPEAQCFAEAQQAIDNALRISPSIPAAHSMLSQLLIYRDWNFTEAEREATLATQLQFGSGTAHIDLAWALVLNRNYPAAVREIAIARSIDPYNPSIDYDEMFIGFGLHDCKRILSLSDRFSRNMANLPSALSLAAWGYLTCGHQPQAIAILRKVATIFNDPKWAAFEDNALNVWQKGGDKAYFQLGLRAYQTHSVSHAFESNLNEEEWADLAGDDKLAFQLVKSRADAHDNTFLIDLLSPVFRGLRQTPEFQSLLHQVTR